MSRPALSIVIGAHNAGAVIDTCLSALAMQCVDGRAEVILADSSTDGSAAAVRERFPWVRLLAFDDPLTVPQLRGRGIAEARGPVVAILDPYSVAASDWVDRTIDAHARQPHPVIGGSVGLYREAEASMADWTLFLNEYGLFMPPITRGETWIVPGSNVAYKRAVLFDGDRPRYPVFWKTFANRDIEGLGLPLWLEPSMRVDLFKPIPLADYFRTRYDHGRCFAGMRVAGAAAHIRLARAATTPAVPFVLLWRWTRGFWPKGRRRARYLAVVPAQAAFFTMWAWGEARGYLGGPGRCCERLFY